MRNGKQVFALFVVLLLVALPAAAQIQIKPTKLDFGDVAVRSSINLSIEISRPANAQIPAEQQELRIEVRNPSAPFSLERSGGVLKLGPGGKLMLWVRFKPTDIGVFTASLGLIAKDRNNAIVDRQIVTLRGRGIAPLLRVNPKALDFGAVPIEKTAKATERQLVIKNKGSDVLKGTASLPAANKGLFELSRQPGGAGALGALESADASPAAAPREFAFSVAPGGSLTLRVRVKPDRASQPGKVTGTLRFKTNDHKKPTTNVTLAVELIAPQIKATPTKLNLGKLKVNEEKISSFELKNEGNKQGSIKLRSLCTQVRVNPPSFTLKAGKARIVQVRVRPTEVGKLQCEVVIESDDPKKPRIIVTVIAEATDTSARMFSDLSPEAEGVELEVFDLSGRKLFASNAMTPFARLHVSTLARNKLLANGVYLYVVTVHRFDGSIIKSGVRKLVIRR